MQSSYSESKTTAGIKTILEVVDLVRQVEGVKDKDAKGKGVRLDQVKRVKVRRVAGPNQGEGRSISLESYKIVFV